MSNIGRGYRMRGRETWRPHVHAPPIPMPHARLLGSLLALLALPASAATITVDSGTDDGTGCTLREAVLAANLDTAFGGCTSGSGADVVSITVPTVTLDDDIGITTPMAIYGLASGGTVIERVGTGRVFVVGEGGDEVIFRYLTVRGGNTFFGAGLYVDQNVTVRVWDSTFEDNVASGGFVDGGAIHVKSLSTLDVRRSTFRGNRALGVNAFGGAIYTSGGTLSIQESTFIDNRAIGDGASGGAIYRLGGATAPLTITDSEFSRNRSRLAGGAVLSGGPATISGTTFSRNTALGGEGWGGALFLSGVTFNRAAVTITGGGILFNAANSGGGLYVLSNADVTLTDGNLRGNQAVGDDPGQGGGGAYVDGAGAYRGTLAISGGELFNNRAVGTNGMGGGILNVGGVVTLTGGAVLDRNRAATAGGGIAVTNPDGGTGAGVVADGATVSGNRVAGAPGDGGGLWASNLGVALDLDNSTFADNDVRGSGGGLWVGGEASLEADNLIVRDNVARGDAADQGGGGLAVDGAGSAVVRLSTVVGNRAIGSLGTGGGVHVKDGAVQTDGTTLAQNYGNRGGGGAAAVAGGTFQTLVPTGGVNSIQGNTTGRVTGDGAGAIALDGGTVLIERATVSGNDAWGGGGALWCADESTCTVRESTVRDNVARLNGGAVYQEGGPASNTLLVDRSLLLFNASERGNGGGLFVEADGTATVQNSTVGGNTARIGGGHYSTGAAVTFDSATIVANEAAVAGGGLGNADGNDRPVSVRNSILEFNTAPNGPNLTGRYTSAGFNIVSTAEPAARFPALATDLMATSAKLSSLKDNGGPTETLALSASSPGLDLGGTALTVDQRGFARDGAADVGAYERGASAVDAPVATRETLLGGAAAGRAAAAGLEAPASPEASAPVRLEAPVPNPTRGRASTRLAVAEAQRVAVTLVDVTGRRVATLFEGRLEADAPVEVAVEASRLAAGVYVVVVEGETVRASTRLSVVR